MNIYDLIFTLHFTKGRKPRRFPESTSSEVLTDQSSHSSGCTVCPKRGGKMPQGFKRSQSLNKYKTKV